MIDCRTTIEELLKEMLLAGFDKSSGDSVGDGTSKPKQIIVQQIKTTDDDGNLRTVYPSKTDLNYDESTNILVERE